MQLTFSEGSCMTLEQHMYIQAIFYLEEENYRHKCKINILAADTEIKTKHIDIKVLHTYPYNISQHQRVLEYLNEKKFDTFLSLRSELVEIVSDEIEKTGNWKDYRLEVLFW
ncbi:hypothetical protein [Peribacillus deserti]|uniref:Uncharacterized protein n=1 Tax=Peribacillus deserti TaxID=673318 RepID=A0A2N5M513_9BACI|nr:hypothetical protein [Peribacillus deserti]PLT29449.1 hypothetical protein CUU66_13180 [Peribacillus deserti]